MNRHYFKFEPRFIDAVTSGAKHCTMRWERKRVPAVGDIAVLQHWIGRPYASKVTTIGERVIDHVAPVFIVKDDGFRSGILITFDGVPLLCNEAEQLAKDDGFASLDDLAAFFKPRLPFHGHFYRWTP